MMAGSIQSWLQAEPFVPDQTKGLLDLRSATCVPLYSEVREIVDAAMKQGGLPLRRAYLVGSAVHYGLVQQMQALAPPQISIQIFTQETEARSWLMRTEDEPRRVVRTRV
jgi:hypothetical protein